MAAGKLHLLQDDGKKEALLSTLVILKSVADWNSGNSAYRLPYVSSIASSTVGLSKHRSPPFSFPFVPEYRRGMNLACIHHSNYSMSACRIAQAARIDLQEVQER